MERKRSENLLIKVEILPSSEWHSAENFAKIQLKNSKYQQFKTIKK